MNTTDSIANSVRLAGGGNLRPSISVAMAVFNGASYIRDQLDSIAAQTRLPDEIVIGDDRSSDDTLAIIDAFRQRTGLTINVQTNPLRLGSTLNFEQTLLRCTGDIIVLSDQDDIWRSDRLIKIETSFLNNPNATYVFSNGVLINESGRTIAGSVWKNALFLRSEQDLFRQGRGAEVLLKHNVVTGAAMAVRRSAIQAALPMPPGCIHDYWLALFLEALGSGVMIDEPLISYRIHSSQQVGLFKVSLGYARAALERHGADYCINQAGIFQMLADRLEQLGAATAIIGGLRKKAAFYRSRSLMRQHLGAGAREILRGWWEGDYSRFTPGLEYASPHIFLDVAACLLPWLSKRKSHSKSNRVQF